VQGSEGTPGEKECADAVADGRQQKERPQEMDRPLRARPKARAPWGRSTPRCPLSTAVVIARMTKGRSDSGRLVNQ
jgi:hypothetical protein